MLTNEEHDALKALHPDGAARFWGVVSRYDAGMDTLETGDIVLFTGKNYVRAVGEVGVSFRNPQMANSMWMHHPEKGSYHNVYSLRSFQDALISYEEIWALPGLHARNLFRQTRFITGERADYLLEDLGIYPTTQAVREAQADAVLTEELSRTTGTTVIPGEALNVTSTTYESPTRTTLVRRSESLLVASYTAHLGITHERTSTPVGLTDLYLPAEGGGHALVEAKSSTSRRHVREAVGQLLDYAPHCPDVTEMAILVPERPDPQTITYAHRYGIDVIYRTSAGSFDKAPAPDQARAAILGLATATRPETSVHQQPAGRSLRGDWQPSATLATTRQAASTASPARSAFSTRPAIER